MPASGRKSRGLLFASLACLAAVVLPLELEGADIRLNHAAAEAYSRKNGGTVLIISTGRRPQFSSYRTGCHLRTPMPVFSITKSLTALACLNLHGLALDQVVRPGSEPVTLRHLLSQTSGIATGYENLYKKKVPDVRRAAAALPQERPPGETFAYGPSHYEMIGSVISPGNSRSDRARLVLTKFLNRLDVHPAGWRTDLGNRIYLSAGAVLTPEDLLKIGRYLLNSAAGSSQLSHGNKVKPAFIGSAANPAYGLGFWLNNPGKNSTERDIEAALATRPGRNSWSRMSLSNAAPRDLICMAGSGGQRVYVIPSLGTVVVRLGRPSGFKDPLFLKALFSLAKQG